jgi:hypothetical protein
VRSIEMRGIISTSSSEAMSSSSGGVIEFRKEGGNAIVNWQACWSARAKPSEIKITWADHVMRRVVACLVKVGQSRLLSGYMLLPTSRRSPRLRSGHISHA